MSIQETLGKDVIAPPTGAPAIDSNGKMAGMLALVFLARMAGAAKSTSTPTEAGSERSFETVAAELEGKKRSGEEVGIDPLQFTVKETGLKVLAIDFSIRSFKHCFSKRSSRVGLRLLR